MALPPSLSGRLVCSVLLVGRINGSAIGVHDYENHYDVTGGGWLEEWIGKRRRRRTETEMGLIVDDTKGEKGRKEARGDKAI